MKTYKDYQKKSSVLLNHYRSVLSPAEYVYLASDSAMCGAGGFLRDIAIGSSVMKNTPLVMVTPGVNHLCRTYKCDSPQNLHERIDTIPDTNGIPVMDEMIRRQLHDLYKKLNRSGITSISTNGLHVMLSPDSIWDESGKLALQKANQWKDISEQKAIQLAIHDKHRSNSQIVISQDVPFLQSLKTLCKTGIKGAPNSDGLITLSINEEGYLYDPFEAAEDENILLARISRKKLAALTQQQPAFIEDSALRHERAAELLQNIKPGLVQSGKSLIVLASKKEPLTHADTLVSRAQENPPTVRFAWLREGLTKTEAITEALLTETATLPHGSKISLITDRVTRAEKIQQTLAEAGVLVEIYSVNKYGFLNNRDKTQPALFASRPPALSTAKNKQLIEQAVKDGDVQAALSLVSDKEALKNGIITCLCEKQAETLEQLIKQADRIPSIIINWWILDYKQFHSPAFLMENPKFFDLLVLALSKCHFFTPQAEKWVDKLQDLEESPAAAKVELSFMITLLKRAIERSGVTGATRIRRTDIPKELPRSERSEVDILRLKREMLLHKKAHISKEIECLQAQLLLLEHEITLLNTELSSKMGN